jgi:hypothetical protein
MKTQSSKGKEVKERERRGREEKRGGRGLSIANPLFSAQILTLKTNPKESTPLDLMDPTKTQNKNPLRKSQHGQSGFRAVER